jgi:hypothetical protein
MNYLGKGLVLVNFLCSVCLLAWAGAIYAQKLDWGWKDPRKYLDERVPSEFDKRAAMVREALRGRDRAAAEVAAAQKDVSRYQDMLPRNHLWYNAELARLESADEDIEVLQVKTDKGQLVLDKQLRPMLDKKVTFTDGEADDPAKKTTEVNRSFVRYRADLDKVRKASSAVTQNIKEQIEKQADLTVRLNGEKDDMGKVVKVGLYGLMEEETRTQDQLQKEMSYLRPLWVRELVDAQLLLERRMGLEARLRELKARLEGRPVARR